LSEKLVPPESRQNGELGGLERFGVEQKLRREKKNLQRKRKSKKNVDL
jgi:hypothetical protein